MSTPSDQLDWSNYRRRDVGDYLDFGSAAASMPEEPQEAEWSDYVNDLMGKFAGLVEKTGTVAKVLGVEDVGTSIETLGADAVDYWNDQISDPYKVEISKDIVRKTEDGSGLFGYEWADPSITTVMGSAVGSIPGTLVGMSLGAGLGKVLQVFANPFGRAELINTLKGAASRKGFTGKNPVSQVRASIKIDPKAFTKAEVQAAKKLNFVDSSLGISSFGVGEGAVSGVSATADVYNAVKQMAPEKLMENERWRQVYDSTDSSMTHLERVAYATETVAKEAGTEAGWQTGLTTALLGAPMGAYFGRILGGARLASTLPRAIATGAAGEAAQEFAQSGAEQYISNLKTGEFDPDIDPFDDVLNAAISGALAGALLGGGFGSAAVGGARTELAMEEEGKQVEARRERVDYLRKIGKPLQDAASQAMNEVPEAEKPVAYERANKIIADWAAEKISMPEALELMNARIPAETVSEAAEEAQPEAEQPVEVEEKAAEPTPEQAEQRLEREAQAPTAFETVNPLELKVDPARFQFKSQTDEQGVSRALKGVKRFEPYKAGGAMVWESKDGDRYIVDGHQRVGLAKRAVETGQSPEEVYMSAYVVREADGVTAEMATGMAALKNIAEGTGSPVDAAKVIREMGAEAQPAIDNLPPTRELVKQGRALANLDEEAFQKVVNEVIDAKHGAIVGELIPEDADMQNAAIEVLRQTDPANATQARAIIEQVRTAGVEVQETEDLFGANVVAESLYLERAKVLDAALRAARRDKTTFRTLIKREGAITGTGKNVLDRAANEAKISDADRALAILTAAANTKGPISDALTAAASRVKAGERQGAVAQDFLAEAMQSIQGDGQPSRVARQPEPSQQPEITGGLVGEALAAEGLYSRARLQNRPVGGPALAELERAVINPVQTGEVTAEQDPGANLLAQAVDIREGTISLPEDNKASMAAIADTLDRVVKDARDFRYRYGWTGRGRFQGEDWPLNYGAGRQSYAQMTSGINSLQNLRDAVRQSAQTAPVAAGEQEDMFGAPAAPEPAPPPPTQQALFSRAGKPLNEIIMTFEVETETGEVFEVEQSADIMLRQLDNRRNAIQQLRNCIRG